MARRSKSRLFSKLIKHVNENARIAASGLSADLQANVTSAVDSATVTSLIETNTVDSAGITSIVSEISDYVQLNHAGTLEAITGTIRWVSPKDITITSTQAVLGTAASGSDCVVVLKKNGSAISTLTIADGSDSATSAGLSISVTEGDYLTHDITTASGSDLNLIVEYTG